MDEDCSVSFFNRKYQQVSKSYVQNFTPQLLEIPCKNILRRKKPKLKWAPKEIEQERSLESFQLHKPHQAQEIPCSEAEGVSRRGITYTLPVLFLP